MSAPLLAAHGLVVERAGRRVLDGVTLALHAGERLALVGANGAGKTTLLRALVGLERASAGTVEAFGEACRDEPTFHRARLRIGFLFQDPDDQLFCATVLEDVAFGPLNQGLDDAAAERQAWATLDALGLAGLGTRLTHQLSGGEKRLAALAGVLAMRPEVLLLDEPTNGLDDANRRHLVGVLRTLPQAMLIASHDRDLLGELTAGTLALSEGSLRRSAPLPLQPPRG